MPFDRQGVDPASGTGSADFVPRALSLVIAIMFLGFLTIATLLPTVALQVGARMGVGDVTASFVVGLQSLATVSALRWAFSWCGVIAALVLLITAREPRHDG